MREARREMKNELDTNMPHQQAIKEDWQQAFFQNSRMSQTLNVTRQSRVLVICPSITRLP